MFSNVFLAMKLRCRFVPGEVLEQKNKFLLDILGLSFTLAAMQVD